VPPHGSVICTGRQNFVQEEKRGRNWERGRPEAKGIKRRGKWIGERRGEREGEGRKRTKKGMEGERESVSEFLCLL